MCSAGFIHGQEGFVVYAEVEPEWPHQGQEGAAAVENYDLGHSSEVPSLLPD